MLTLSSVRQTYIQTYIMRYLTQHQVLRIALFWYQNDPILTILAKFEQLKLSLGSHKCLFVCLFVCHKFGVAYLCVYNSSGLDFSSIDIKIWERAFLFVKIFRLQGIRGIIRLRLMLLK